MTCPISRSGPIHWAYIQNWAQCRPHVSARNAQAIADFILQYVENFSCPSCVSDMKTLLGPNGLFSLTNPQKVFINKDALVYFLWALRTFVTLKVHGRVLSWEAYRASWHWDGQAVPAAIPRWSEQASKYHKTTLKDRLYSFWLLIFYSRLVWMCIGMLLMSLVCVLVRFYGRGAERINV